MLAAVLLCDDRLGQRADRLHRSRADRRRRTPRRPSRHRLRLRRSHPRRSRSPTDSRSGGLSSSREDGSSWTSSATSMRSRPRTPSTPARSPWMGARAATRSSMRARRACSSTSAGRSRATSCACTSRPTSTAAAMSCGCATRMAAYGGLLAGQTWSTVVDENNMPGTIDFESPMAFPSIRQAQVRWTQKLSPRTSWSVAVEDNKSSITVPDEPGKAEYPMPDLTTRLRFEGSRGHVHGAFFLGRARFRPTEGEPDDVTLWGGNRRRRLKTVGRDYALRAAHLRRRRRPLPRGRDRRARRERRVARRRSRRGHGRLRALLVPPLLVERGLQRGVDAGRGLLPGHVQQAPRLRRPSISSTGFCRTAHGPASSISTAAARSSAARTAPPTASSSPFASTCRRSSWAP